MLIKRKLWRSIILVFVVILPASAFFYSDIRLQIVSQLHYQSLFRKYSNLLQEISSDIEYYIQESQLSIVDFVSNLTFEIEDNTQVVDAVALRSAISKFTLSFPEIAYIRVFDTEYSRLLFSNNEEDVAYAENEHVQLKSIDQVFEDNSGLLPLLDSFALKNSATAISFDSADNAIVYLVRSPSLSEKIFIVYVSASGMERMLVQSQLIDMHERVLVLQGGILLNALRSIDYASIDESQMTNSSHIIFDRQFEYLNFQNSGAFTTYYYLVSAMRFQLSNQLRIIVYALIFVTLVLLALLIVYLFQDPKTIIRERIRAFQSYLLCILEKNDSLDAERLDAFISLEKERIYRKIVSGSHSDAGLQQYFERRWLNVLTVLQVTGVLTASRRQNLLSDDSDDTVPRHTKFIDAQEESTFESLGDDSADMLLPAGSEDASTPLVDERSDLDKVLSSDALRSAQDTNLQSEDVSADVEDLVMLTDEQPVNIVDIKSDGVIKEEAHNSRADVDQPMVLDAMNKKVGVHFKKDDTVFLPAQLSEIEEDILIENNTGLFIRARNLKYNVIIARQAGIYSLNPNLIRSMSIDKEWRTLINEIS